MTNLYKKFTINLSLSFTLLVLRASGIFIFSKIISLTDLGLLYYFLGVIVLLDTIFANPLKQTVIFYSNSKSYLSISLIISVFIAISCFIGTLIFSQIVKQIGLLEVFLMNLILLFLVMLGLFASYDTGLEKHSHRHFVQIISQALKIFFSLLLFFTISKDINQLLLGTLIGYFLPVLYYFIIYRKKLFFVKDSKKVLKKIINYSKYFFPNSLSSITILILQTILIIITLVGYSKISAFQRLQGILILLAFSIRDTILPVFIKHKKKDYSKKVLKKIMYYLLPILFLSIAGVYTFSKEFLSIYLTPEFAESSHLFELMTISTFLTVMFIVNVQMLFSKTENLKKFFKIILLGNIIRIIFTIPTIYLFKETGFVISLIVVELVNNLLLQKYHQVYDLSFLKKIIIQSVITLITIIIIKNLGLSLIPKFIAINILFLSLLLITKEMKISKIFYVIKIIKKR